MLLVAYAFAALAKWNTGFLDPTVSCAVVYTDQWLGGFGLAGVAGHLAEAQHDGRKLGHRLPRLKGHNGHSKANRVLRER